jgi:uncharacterized protein YbdZ (MbtH family)
MFEDDDIRQYDVVRNEAEQYAVWPVGSLVPLLLSPVRHLAEVQAVGITAGASSE